MTEQIDDSVEIVGTHEVYGGWSKLLVATISMPDGRVLKREIEDHGEAVCVLRIIRSARRRCWCGNGASLCSMLQSGDSTCWKRLPASSRMSMPRLARTAR